MAIVRTEMQKNYVKLEVLHIAKYITYNSLLLMIQQIYSVEYCSFLKQTMLVSKAVMQDGA